MRKLGDKLREKKWACGGLIPQPSCLKQEREEEKKENIMGVMGINLGSPKSEKWSTKFDIVFSVAQGILSRVPLTNSVLTHKLYMNKYLMNASSKIRNQDLGIPTRCINLVPQNLG